MKTSSWICFRWSPFLKQWAVFWLIIATASVTLVNICVSILMLSGMFSFHSGPKINCIIPAFVLFLNLFPALTNRSMIAAVLQWLDMFHGRQAGFLRGPSWASSLTTPCGFNLSFFASFLLPINCFQLWEMWGHFFGQPRLEAKKGVVGSQTISSFSWELPNREYTNLMSKKKSSLLAFKPDCCHKAFVISGSVLIPLH